MKFFDIISNLIPGGFLSEREASALSALDPQKFYVENVRSILNVSSSYALKVCETAVRQGLFEKRIEVYCPDGAVVASAKTEKDLPPIVRCWKEENGLHEEVEIPTASLRKEKFYRLNEASTQPYSRPACRV
jgi:hypothetical protein